MTENELPQEFFDKLKLVMKPITDKYKDSIPPWYKEGEIYSNRFFNENTMASYDSSTDTLKHIKRVNELLGNCAVELIKRGQVHDNSKLEEPEKSEFDRLTPILKNLVYGSEEYKNSLKELGKALEHHYMENSHHPEHWGAGINGMDLFDLIEMLMDWKAATERTKDGDIFKSLEINKQRFNISDQLSIILRNTAGKLFSK